MKEEAARTVEVFYSYAQEDEPLRQELEKHLTFLSEWEHFTHWHKGLIPGGNPIDDEIAAHLNTAHIILLLVSSDFLASKFCYVHEVKEAFKRHDTGGVCVIPVILRPVLWKMIPPLKELQPLPRNGRPITTWTDRDEAFADVAEGILEVVLRIRGQWTDEQQTNNHYKVLYYNTILDISIQTIHDDPEDASAYHDRGKALYHLGEYEEALAAYKRSLQLDPGNIDTYLGIGAVLCRLERYEEALQIYEQARGHDPDDTSIIGIYREKGALLYKRGDYEEALVCYEQICLRNPDDSSAPYSKGVVLNKLALYEEALVAFNLAIHLNPNNASAYYSKGNMLIKLKRYKEALVAYEQALQLNPDDIDVYCGIGNLHSFLAHQAFEKVQQLRSRQANDI